MLHLASWDEKTWIALVSTLISIVTLVSTIVVNVYYNSRNTRRALRESHNKLLFDIGKSLVDKPELWTIYDKHPLSDGKAMDHKELAKRQAFIYQHFNMFVLAHDYYENCITPNKVDKDFWNSWNNYMQQFFRESTEARNLFKEPRTQEIYRHSFLRYCNRIIEQCSGEMKIQ